MAVFDWTRIGGERRRGVVDYSFVAPGALSAATPDDVDLGALQAAGISVLA